MAAVLSDNHGIFAWGWNTPSFTKDEKKFDIHAEEHAFNRSNPHRLRGATLTVYGVKKNGKNVLSRPCERRCMNLALKHGVRIIEYVTESGEWVTLKLGYMKY